MNKERVIGIFLALIVLIGIIIILPPLNEKISGSVIEEINDEEYFAKMNAEIACDFSENKSKDQYFDMLDSIEIYAQKYGLSSESIGYLQLKYKNDESFQKIVSKEMKKFCPEIFT